MSNPPLNSDTRDAVVSNPDILFTPLALLLALRSFA